MTAQDRKGRSATKTNKTKAAKMKPNSPVKKRNAPAAALADPRYRARVVKSAKAYNRKNKPVRGEDDGG